MRTLNSPNHPSFHFLCSNEILEYPLDFIQLVVEALLVIATICYVVIIIYIYIIGFFYSNCKLNNIECNSINVNL